MTDSAKIEAAKRGILTEEDLSELAGERPDLGEATQEAREHLRAARGELLASGGKGEGQSRAESGD